MSSQSARAAALRYLSRSVRSVEEARTYLARRRVSSADAHQWLKEFQAAGVLNDQICARLAAEHWARQGYAWAAIEQKLSAKGLDEHTIAQTGMQLARSSSDDERARHVLARTARRRAGRPSRSRLAQALASRGFESDFIERTLGQSFPDDER